jgi:glycosyltransferase involved in cell wall biosynthesis/Flp pilus assembly protein TadD
MATDPTDQDPPGWAILHTARELIAINRLDPALRVLSAIEPDDPAWPQASMLEAAILHHLGRFADALVPLARLVAIDPATAQGVGNMALMLNQTARAHAFKWHRRATVLAPTDCQILVNAGTFAIGSPHDDLATRWFQTATALDPARAECHAALGLIQSARARAGAALDPYRRAAALQPMSPVPRFMYGSALQTVGRLDEAETVYAEAAVLKWRARGAPAAAVTGKPRLGLGWKPGFEAGWDVYGANLVKRLEARGDIEPVVINPVAASPDEASAFAELYARSLDILAPALEAGRVHDFPGLIALGNDFSRHPCLGRTAREIGVIFLEDTHLSAAGRARAISFDLVIAGATWGAEILRGLGLTNVKTVLQGIDPSLFHPHDRALRPDVFRIFSGGKLEFRKGQDLVIAAFKIFHARYPDSRLVCAWQSPWPQVARSVPWGGVIHTAPAIGADHKLDLAPWLISLGLAPNSVEILGLLPNHQMPSILRTMDCALFPNRCEGGTNLVAMEAMAAGLPVILSANTGHLDLIEEGNCLALRHQHPVTAPVPMGLDGWGASDVDEIVAHLETLYHARDDARIMGLKGAERLTRLTWPGQIDALIDAIGPL